jgi:hypothetical protein
MKKFETATVESEGEEINLEEAATRAGLTDIELPRIGTPAYDRLVAAAKKYIEETQRMEREASHAPALYGDSENSVISINPKKPSPSSSGSIRRQYHDELAMMLMGSKRTGMDKEEADKISDFAAYLTGHEEYVGTW